MIQIRHVINVRWLASQVALSNNGFLLSGARNQSTKQEENEKVHFVNFEDTDDPEEVAAKEALIEQKRNKSKLFPPDYNRQHDKMPYDQPQSDFHESLSYKRRIYGKYGESSGVDPRILWPSKKELNAMKEYDEAQQPYTFHELLARLRERKELAEKQKREEEAKILQKIKSVKSEILEFKNRVDNKIKQAREIAEKKNKLVMEARKKLGYCADERDARLKEIIEQIQKEEKMKVKAAKKALIKEKVKGRSEMTTKEVESSNDQEKKEKEN